MANFNSSFRGKLAVGAFAAVLLASGTVSPAMAYFTDIADTMENPFTIALDSTSEIVEKYPDPDPDADGNVVSYEKSVQVINTGYIDEYVRVRLDFTEDDIESKTEFSWDGTNFWSVDEYKDHLPDGWVYNESDGYYYYTVIVESGDWDDVKNRITYDEEAGHYVYTNSNGSILELAMITTPLIRYVRTTFDSASDMRSYGLNVFSESCPFYFGSDYSSAWASYLNG